MTNFVIYFFICNLFISGIIFILFTTKKALQTKISHRMQYHLSFLLFALLMLPFLPIRSFPVFTWLNVIAGTFTEETNPTPQELSTSYLADTSKQVNDFAISVSHRAPSAVGNLLCLLWFIGIFIMIVFLIRSSLHLHKIIKSSLPLQNRKIRNLYYECLRETGIHVDIPVYSTAYLKSPAIVGFLKPRIFLPIHTISDEHAASIRLMIYHELQHLKHKDMAVNQLIILAGIVYWFNPFVWYALKEMKCERELACDSSVLQMLPETEFENYGNTLINFAEKISRKNHSVSSFPFVAGIGGNRKQIRRRILNIANYKKETRPQKMQSRLACIFILAIFLVLIPVLPTYATGQNTYSFHEEGKRIIYQDFRSQFKGYQGSFVLYDSGKNAWTIYHKEAALEQITPNSTYKIYDALLGLESGIISPEHSKLAWNGEDYPFDAWKADQDLSSAMRSSVNWYFQTIDHKVGWKHVKSFLQEIGYGNQQIGNDMDLYWTDFSLKISPLEQVELLKKFYHNDFGFSYDNINAVKDSILLSRSPNGTLSGKTGTGRVDGQDTNGWFIGYIEKSGHVYYFATNIQGVSNANGSVATEISLSILSDMGLWDQSRFRGY